MSPVLARALLFVVSTALAITLVEYGLRIRAYGGVQPLEGEHVLREPHPTRGWSLTPGRGAYQRSPDFAVYVEINDQGLRDRPHAYRPAPGTTRIVVLGDSYMEAYQVELEESLPYQLQARLEDRGVEVVNLGVGGYGTAQSLLALKEEGLRYQPDVVVLGFYTGNDIHNDSRALQQKLWGEDDAQTYGRPYASAVSLDGPLAWTPPDFERMQREAKASARRRAAPGRRAWKWIEPTLLGNRLGQVLARAAARLGASPADPKVHFGWPFLADFENDDWDAAWLTTRRLLLELRDVSRQHGAAFVVMIVPAKLQVEPDFREAVRAQYPGIRLDETRVNRALAEFCAGHDIPLFDPTPSFVRHAQAGETLYFQLDDHHWNARGHSLASEGLAAFLEGRALLPGP